MSQEKRRVTYECAEQLHTWVYANCPCALENPEFLPGLIVVVEEEVERAIREACWKWQRKAGEPCSN